MSRLSVVSHEQIRYNGQWKEGKKYGEGVWRWSNGRTRCGVVCWLARVLGKAGAMRSPVPGRLCGPHADSMDLLYHHITAVVAMRILALPRVSLAAQHLVRMYVCPHANSSS